VTAHVERFAVWVPSEGISFRGAPGIEGVPHVVTRSDGAPLCRLARCSALTGDYRPLRYYSEQTATVLCDQCVRTLAAHAEVGESALVALRTLPERVMVAIERAGVALTTSIEEPGERSRAQHNLAQLLRDLRDMLADHDQEVTHAEA